MQNIKSTILVVANDSARMNVIGKTIERQCPLATIQFCHHPDEVIEYLLENSGELEMIPVLLLIEMNHEYMPADLKMLDIVRQALPKEQMPAVVFVPEHRYKTLETEIADHGGNLVVPITDNEAQLENAIEDVTRVWIESIKLAAA